MPICVHWSIGAVIECSNTLPLCIMCISYFCMSLYIYTPWYFEEMLTYFHSFTSPFSFDDHKWSMKNMLNVKVVCTIHINTYVFMNVCFKYINTQIFKPAHSCLQMFILFKWKSQTNKQAEKWTKYFLTRSIATERIFRVSHTRMCVHVCCRCAFCMYKYFTTLKD